MENKGNKNGICNFIKRFIDFIGRDSSGKNESKKIIVIIRIMIILYAFYIIANMVICDLTFYDLKSLVFSFFFLLFFIGTFASSYYYKTSFTLWIFNISTIVWVIGILYYFGWNVGVQHFLVLLLMLYFFSSYRNYTNKIIFAVSICVLRVLLFYFFHARVPVWQLTATQETILQILNTVTIFGSISVVSFIFSKDSQELEGKLIEYNNQLEKQANTDTLTGLFNRRKAIEYMDKIVSINNSFSLCICDIDFFKKVNDNYGHDFGDLVLKQVSKVLQEEMQGKNLVARWGGEEFLLLFPDCNGDDACVKLQQIRNRIKETKIQNEDVTVSITMTFGLAEYDFQDGLDATLKDADKKLYMGKERGRDIIIF